LFGGTRCAQKHIGPRIYVDILTFRTLAGKACSGIGRPNRIQEDSFSRPPGRARYLRAPNRLRFFLSLGFQTEVESWIETGFALPLRPGCRFPRSVSQRQRGARARREDRHCKVSPRRFPVPNGGSAERQPLCLCLCLRLDDRLQRAKLIASIALTAAAVAALSWPARGLGARVGCATQGSPSESGAHRGF
jgi:hypothetical protein